ncbi:hypothetical protein GCM10010405_23830 [Streptomyces macrosporus]|uniref:Uncharacterized protein n=1 Tax=Streptomyces macrosporus TaxID=44032 RepID=A0ABN3JVU0_9ACTN
MATCAATWSLTGKSWIDSTFSCGVCGLSTRQARQALRGVLRPGRPTAARRGRWLLEDLETVGSAHRRVRGGSRGAAEDGGGADDAGAHLSRLQSTARFGDQPGFSGNCRG